MVVAAVGSIYYPPFCYGFTNLFLAILLLILTVLVTVGIRWRDNYAVCTSYQIMFGISVFDIIQLVEHLFSGIVLMLEWDIPKTLNYILGAVMSGAWMSLNVLGIFLAVHRMISLAYPLEEQRLFSGMKKTILFAVAFSVFPIYTGLQLSVWTRYQFTREKFMWEYDPSLPLSAVFQKIDDYTVVVFLIFAGICYSIIFYIMTRGQIDKRKERAFTVQVFVYCLFCALSFCLWQFIDPIVQPKPISNFWTSLPWIFWNGAHAIICMVFNKSIRETVLRIVLCKMWTCKIEKTTSSGRKKCSLMHVRSSISP